MSDRRDIARLATELQKLSGAAFERRLESALHQTWDDGWCERDQPEPLPNPYNVLTRVPEAFLKAATEYVRARAEVIEKTLNEHLFPGLFEKQARAAWDEDSPLSPDDLRRIDDTRARTMGRLGEGLSLQDVLSVRKEIHDAPMPTLTERVYFQPPAPHVVVRAADGRTEDPCLGNPCEHTDTFRGADIPRRYGSYRSQVCRGCWCFRPLTHFGKPAGPWQPQSQFAEATAPLEDE